MGLGFRVDVINQTMCFQGYVVHMRAHYVLRK